MSTEHRWTGEQASAITSARHTLLAAGAGTGKTTTLIGKILWHLGLASGIDERTGQPLPPCPAELRCTLPEIVAITFTEKAAHDLKRKLRESIEAAAPHLLWDIDRAYIGTIHGFCGQLLREHALRFGIDPGFAVMDERETRVELMALIRDLVLRKLTAGDERAEALIGDSTSLDGWEHQKGPLDLVAAMLRDLRWHRSRYEGWLRDGILDVEGLHKLAGCWDAKDGELSGRVERLRSLAAEALAEWEAWLLEENQRDFDAMVLDCRDRLASEIGQPALESIRSRIKLLVIDEFQDTDDAQRDIAFLLAGLGTETETETARLANWRPTLFLVGDPKQSIYGFRGADIGVWNEVRGRLAKFGPALELTGNFRSDPAVIEFANRASSHAIGTTGLAVETAGMASRVRYTALDPRRKAAGTGQVEWLVARGRNADERREAEAEAVAARIRHLVIDPALGDAEGVQVVDPDTGQVRDCSYRDVAVLFRTRAGVECLAQALARYGVPFYLAGDAGLTNRLEIADLLNLFQLVANPMDDLAAMAWMRSPFVGLRDEVIARIRLGNVRVPLFKQARDFLGQGTWYEAPEHPRVGEVERDALRAGLDLIQELITLRSRVPIDQLAELALEKSGYPLHLLLLPQPDPKLANLTRFVRILEGYRNQTLGTFLELWGRWEDQDLGIPQAPLYSKRDNVVTLSTIHAAKGLEWPVVFLAGVDGGLPDKLSGAVWSDRDLGPMLGIKQDDRGARAQKLCVRKLAEEAAEEARIVYVAATRARDRLIIAAPESGDLRDIGEWLWAGVDEKVQVHREEQKVEAPPLPPEPQLAWLDDLVVGPSDGRMVGRLRQPAPRLTRSATELMSFKRNREHWRSLYVHGVLPQHLFVRSGAGVPAAVRGTVIHEVLENIDDETQLAELLDVAVGSLDSPELEERLARGTAEREAIEAEIQKVVASPEWRWYVEGPHWRELSFVQFRHPRKWYVGAFDLYRPGEPTGLIVDFKTQTLKGSAEAEARKYRLQALVYRTVSRRLGHAASVRFHFTVNGETVES